MCIRNRSSSAGRFEGHISGGINSWGQLADEFLEGNPRFTPTHVGDPDPASSATFWTEMEEVIVVQRMRRAGALTSAVFAPHPLFEGSQTMDFSIAYCRTYAGVQYDSGNRLVFTRRVGPRECVAQPLGRDL